MSEIGGSEFKQIGSISLGCISSDARDLLDDIVAAYKQHYNPDTHTAKPDDVYQFAYWLVRWSGLVTRAAPPRHEPDERQDGLLMATCPECNRRDSTGITGEVVSGVIRCGYCGAVSSEYIDSAYYAEQG